MTVAVGNGAAAGGNPAPVASRLGWRGSTVLAIACLAAYIVLDGAMGSGRSSGAGMRLFAVPRTMLGGAGSGAAAAAGAGGRPRAVMVCVSGLLRALVKPDVIGMLEYSVLAPLARAWPAVYTCFCTEKPPAEAAAHAARHGRVAVHVGEAKSMFERRLCCSALYKNISKEADVKWVVSVRTDTIYFEKVPDLAALKPGIHLRSRLWGADKGKPVNRHHSWMSAWYGNENPGVNFTLAESPVRSVTCKEAAEYGCMTFDDQVAILDGGSVDAYFSTPDPEVLSLPFPVSSNVSGCAECEMAVSWPEGHLTRNVMASGAPLHVLSWSVRMERHLREPHHMLGLDPKGANATALRCANERVCQ